MACIERVIVGVSVLSEATGRRSVCVDGRDQFGCGHVPHPRMSTRAPTPKLLPAIRTVRGGGGEQEELCVGGGGQQCAVAR